MEGPAERSRDDDRSPDGRKAAATAIDVDGIELVYADDNREPLRNTGVDAVTSLPGECGGCGARRSQVPENARPVTELLKSELLPGAGSQPSTRPNWM